MNKIYAFLLVSMFMPLHAGHAMMFDPFPKWKPYIDIELKASNDRKINRTNFFYPLVQDDDSMLFADLRVRLDKSKDFEGNIGLGYRRLYPEKDLIIGSYGFFDRRVSAENHFYTQFTFGSEILTRYWDFRFNTYLNEHKERPVRNQFTSVSTNTANQVLISQDLSTERPLSGFDVEAGRKIPHLEKLTLSAAYFHYKKSHFRRIEGLRFRGEYNVTDHIRIIAEAQRDAVRDREYYTGLGFNYPLYENKKKLKKLTPLEKRMLTRVYRDIDVVTGANQRKIENEPAQLTINGRSSRHIYRINAANPKTLKDLLSTIEEDAIIIIDGSAGTFALTDTATMKTNQTLIGTTPGGSLTFSTPLGLPVIASISQSEPTLTRSTAMLAGDQPLIAIPNQGNVSLSNLILRNADNSIENAKSMVRNTGTELVSATFDRITTDDQLDIQISSGTASATFTNCTARGIEVRALGGSTINAIANDNTTFRNDINVNSLGGGFFVWTNIFFDTNNNSRINVLSFNNNHATNDGSKTPAAAFGFFAANGSIVQVTEMLDNTSIGNLIPANGAFLYQGLGTGRVNIDKVLRNTGSDFVAVRANVNIGQSGFTANAAGVSAANNLTVFSNFGTVTITNNF